MRLPALLVLCLASGACSAAKTPAAPPQAEAAPVPAGGVVLQELPPQVLRKGDCMLALWSRGAVPQRIFASFANPPVARVRIGGQTRELARTGLDGPQAFGHARRQTYAAGDLTLQVDLGVVEGRGLLGGAVAPNGSLTVSQAGGWEAVVPVGGMIACEA